jgi:hypothetical protein
MLTRALLTHCSTLAPISFCRARFSHTDISPRRACGATLVRTAELEMDQCHARVPPLARGRAGRLVAMGKDC